jgi:hypothetical protein
MQTFVPYGSNFTMNAQCLDLQRLGKQRVETWQILNAMSKGGGWRNHPATKMWIDYPDALIYYGIEMCEEWIRRGYNDTMLERFKSLNPAPIQHIGLPPWLNDPEVMRSHRSNLIRKDWDHYGMMWPDVPDNLEYVWPVA